MEDAVAQQEAFAALLRTTSFEPAGMMRTCGGDDKGTGKTHRHGAGYLHIP
eukprot:CAMPEP_0172081182 /NCGR_PEP_ID=MMETSP1043-20130122/19165_1 /TAXON_ID=464988 /ORGANISM="Hemiselmis andersenii, Strain CCMP441" /LENGTH=50 /DNA_ID=CAMNT_0012742605 /DNA_START=83 /DNA_END=232 /DNA_ORIENTATION=+